MEQKSEAEVRKELRLLLDGIEAGREDAQKRGLAFTSLTEEELIQKLRGETTNSPFVSMSAWDQFTTPGGRAFYLANYYNPDPGGHLVTASIFFGLGMLAPDFPSAYMMRDTDWPSFSLDWTIIEPGKLGVAEFEYTAPFAAKGTYFGNGVLWGGNDLFRGGGIVFDRMTFFTKLS